MKILSVPSVVTILTSQSNWFTCLEKYQPINARGSDPDPFVCMKVRFEAKVTRGFSLSPRPFGDSLSLLRGLLLISFAKKNQEKPLGPGYSLSRYYYYFFHLRYRSAGGLIVWLAFLNLSKMMYRLACSGRRQFVSLLSFSLICGYFGSLAWGVLEVKSKT